jgi:catechol 2,3-dioxygenase-like lactoylglutathione lyase family enzyme/quercetin dioxygenase-like cupin family protein
MDSLDDREPLLFLGKRLSPSFKLWVLSVAPGCERAYNEAEWRDEIVVVEQGRIELQCSNGSRQAFGRGDLLWLLGPPLRALHNPGEEPSLLVAISRRTPARPSSSGATASMEERDEGDRSRRDRYGGFGGFDLCSVSSAGSLWGYAQSIGPGMRVGGRLSVLRLVSGRAGTNRRSRPSTKGPTMWDDAHAATRLPAQDLERARVFYREKLGLEAAEERPGGLRYVLGDSEFALFASSGGSPGTFTQMAIYVGDIEATVTTLRDRGVEFERYDVYGLTTRNGIAELEGNYPSKGSGERAAWLRDSEGNLIAIGQLLP